MSRFRMVRGGLPAPTPSPTPTPTPSPTPAPTPVLAGVLHEGDSISGGFPNGYAAANPSVTPFTNASAGFSRLAGPGPSPPTLESRFADDIAYLPQVFTVLIGANDMTTSGDIDYSGLGNHPDPTAWLADLFAYFADWKAAVPGVYIMACTLTPRSGIGNVLFGEAFAHRRAIVNQALRDAVGTEIDAVCDFAANATIGDDADADDTSKYYDGLHPTSPSTTPTGTTVATMVSIYTDALNALIASIPEPFYTIPIPEIAFPVSRPSGDPLAVEITVDGYPIGLDWYVQIAGNAAFTEPLEGETEVRTEQRIVTVSDLTDEDLDGAVEADNFVSMENIPAGLLYYRIRLGRESDDGTDFIWGAWSNVLTDTIGVLQESVFSATEHGAYFTFSPDQLTATSNLVNFGVPNMARLDNSRNGERYAELNIDSIPSSAIHFGIGPSTHNWTGSNVPLPGTLTTAPQGGRITNGGSAIVNGTTTNSVTVAWAAGDRVCMAYSEAAGKVWFGLSRAGVRTWNGVPGVSGGFTFTGGATQFAFVALTIKSADQRAVSWVPTADLTHAPPTGFIGYDA